MSFDGIITQAMAKELSDALLLGKIDNVYQPESDELVFQVYTKQGIRRLYATTDSTCACLRLIDQGLENPPQPQAFCMLLRKHLRGGRITAIEQKDSERIIEFSLETLNDLGFTVARKLIFEIMGKHSNIVLLDTSTGKIIDSIKRISIDVNRVRQLLPGKLYAYPPAQDKIPYKEADQEQLRKAGPTGKALLASIGGISPSVARHLAAQKDRYGLLRQVMDEIEKGCFVPRVYLDDEGTPREYHILPLYEYEATCQIRTFDTLSHALTFFFENKLTSNRAKQKSRDLVRAVSAALDKHYLKDQRLKEDLLAAENSDPLRLYGELLTANMHLLKPGMTQITVTNYYDNSQVTIPLDPRFSPNKNAQNYFKRYGKARTAIHEKKAQLEKNRESIQYLESVLTYLNNTGNIREIEALREELEETGFLRRRKQSRNRKNKRFRPEPRRFSTKDGFTVLVGRNNRENDALTLKMADKADYWLHTKDIPGSHVIIRTEGKEITETAIREAAAIAAFYSKARASESVPVDYVKVRYVKKPAGARPGMVIFTHNRTIYVDPCDPEAPGSRP